MAFKRWSKTPSKSPPQYNWSQDKMKIIGWCLNKNIHVAVSRGEIKWKVEIRLNKGNWNKDPGVYEHEEAMKKMYEYYKYYYDKYNKQ